MDRIIKDGHVAVLFSPGFGAGWYTWNTQYPQLLFDPVVVAHLLSEETGHKRELELERYLENKYPEIYTGGLRDLRIYWVPEGTMFRIHEYDGSETVILESEDKWFMA